MHWSVQYIGQPYAEANCAQLAVQVQREVFDHLVTLPGGLAVGLRAQTRQINELQDVVADPVDRPSEGDAVLMQCRGSLSHVGVYCLIDGVPYVLHSMRNAGHAVMHRLCDLKAVGLSVEGFYRWR